MRPAVFPDSTGEQYPSLPSGPGDLLVLGEVHPARPTAIAEAPYLWDQCLPEWWQYFLANVYSQEGPSIDSDATTPCTEWPECVDGPTARSPVFSQSQNPVKPPPTSAHGNFDGRFGNQAGAMPDCHTHAEYSQHIATQEEHIQLTRRQLLERGIDSPSTPGGVQLYRPRDANKISTDGCFIQVSQQQREECKEVRQDPGPGSTRSPGNCRKAPGGLHCCTNCNKAYQRAQDLKRHTRDKHDRQRKCPFCCTRWSRPERIRVHLMKKHRCRLTKDQQQEIRSLRGQDDTIRFLEKYRNITHPGDYTPD